MAATAQFFRSRRMLWIVVSLACLLGLAIRAYDLTDPPLDFHPTRQLRSAIIARGMYFETLTDIPEWQQEQAVRAWRDSVMIEPLVMERLAAWMYRMAGAEQLWIPRLMSALFWVGASLAVLFIGQEIATLDGGVVALFYMLFLPYGIYATRTFQPDPLMVALIAWALWAVLRWYRLRSMPMAISAGLLAGLAIYIKTVGIFFIAGAFIGLILMGLGLRHALRDRQVWVMAALALLPISLYYIYGLWIAGFLQQQLKYRFFPDLLRDVVFYIRWQEMATNISGFGTLLVALVAFLMIEDRGKRGLLTGLWVGYGVYSLVFAYHTMTHDYYQLPLILVVGVSITVALSELLQRIASVEQRNWMRTLVVLLLFAGAAFKAWDVRVNLARKDYRSDVAYWEQFHEIIEPDARVISMSQVYGVPLNYYGWVSNDFWLGSGDIAMRALAGETNVDFEAENYAAIEQYDYFIITRLNEFNDTPELKTLLYENYQLYAEGDGYIVFDLREGGSD